MPARPHSVGTTLEPLTIRLHWRANEPVEAPLFSFVVWTDTGQALANPGMLPLHSDGGPVYEGAGYVDYHIDRLPLSPGVYSITAAAHDSHAMTVYDRADDIVNLHVQPGLRPVRGVVDLVGGWSSLEGSSTSSAPGGAKMAVTPVDPDERVHEETP